MTTYKHLEPRRNKQQFYIKGKRIAASVIYSDMIANQMTIEEMAKDLGLPIEAIQEAVHYCETKLT